MASMSNHLESLIRDCTVQVIGEERGTGFFVAPGIVITCAHVTGSRRPPAVRWQRNGQSAVEATASGPARTLDHAERPIPALDAPYPDIAVIEVPALTDHPCVAVDDDWPQDLDTFYVCGYPREGGAELLTPARLSYRGMHATDPAAYIDLAEDTIKPGMSGAALVNLRTGGVCGVLVATKHPRQPDGGLAVPWAAAKGDLEGPLAANRAFHRRDQRWNAIAARRPRRRRPPDITRPLPENFEPRDDLIALAKDALRAASPSGGAHVVGLVGMGGTGKSVLACALARDDEVKQAFGDGIVWLEFGQRADPIARQKELAAAFGDERQAADPVHRLHNLEELLDGARCLVILDDVVQHQQLRHFELSVPESALLVTARDSTVLGQSGAVRSVPVYVLPPGPAWRLLTNWAAQGDTGLPPEATEVADQCEGLPLALAIAGAMVAHGHSWRYLRDAIWAADLHEILIGLPYYPREYENLFRVLDASVSCLKPADRECYLALAVFDGRGAVPAEVAFRLWRRLGLTEHNSERLIIELASRSLLRYDTATGTISMHGLQYAYARGRLGKERLRDLHGLLASAILDGWGSLGRGLPELPASRLADPVERYGVVQLTAHLEAADRDDDIHRLLAVSAPVSISQPGQVGNAWYAAHTRIGQTIAYDADLRLAWDRAKALADQAQPEARPVPAIGLEIRYALLSASLSSLTARIPPPLIAALVADGQWTVSLGVRHARMLPDAEAAARTLVDLLAHADGTDDDANVPAAELGAEALAAAQAVGNPVARATLLAALAAHTPTRAAAVREAWQAIGAIPAEQSRARAIAALANSAKRLPKKLRDEALRVAAESASPRSVAIILTALAPQLPPAERPGIVAGAQRAARRISHPGARATELSALLPLLPPDERVLVAREASAEVERIPAGLAQASAFATLAGLLPDSADRSALLVRAEQLTSTISQQAEKAVALTTLAARVPGKARRQALIGLAFDAICAETDLQARADALIALIALDRESADLRAKAEDVIGKIGQPTARAVALTALADRVGQGGYRSALLARALAEASVIDDAAARAAGLAALIRRRPGEDNAVAELGSRAIRQAIADAQASGQPQTQVAVAAALAPVAREDRAAILDRASLTARQLVDPRDRATACTALIPQLTGTARDDAMGRAARAAADIPDQHQQRAALLALLAAAPDVVSWQADAVTHALLAVNDRLRELRGAVVAAGADIEDRPSMLASILTAPALVLPSDTDLLPPETGAPERRTVSRGAEPVISAVGELRARAAALLVLTKASTGDTAAARPSARTVHAIEQAWEEMLNAGGLLRELSGPLRTQLLAASEAVEAASQAVEAAARLPAPDAAEPVRAAEPQSPGQQPDERAASMPPWAPDWRDFVDGAAGRGRSALMSELPTLGPAIARYGGSPAVAEAIRALLDVGHWWP
jgi:NB-ARC domain/Trypsin-like peptidase domain